MSSCALKPNMRSPAATPVALPSVLRVVIGGEPVPKGRARHRIVMPKGGAGGRGAPFVQEYTPKETKAYEDRVRLLTRVAVNQARWLWTTSDRFSIVLRIFRSYWDKGGDCDNYVKAVLDGMNTIAFADDRYIRGIGASLMRPDPKNPRVEVELRRFPKGSA